MRALTSRAIPQYSVSSAQRTRYTYQAPPAFTRSSSRAFTEQPVRGHRALALDLDRAALFAVERLRQRLAKVLRDVHSPRLAVALEPRGDVDGVAPDVVRELGPADHARHDRATVDPDAHVELGLELLAQRVQRRDHFQGRARRADGVVRLGQRQAGRGHVGVADRLDLLEAVLVRQPVELGE